jgi:uncharacterized LabA/DUF88 family protein
MDDRVAIFIDGSNLYHSVKNNFGRHDLNFTEFANKLTAGRRLFRIYYYNILQDPSQYPEAHKEQAEFLDVLKKTPYLEVRLGSTKKALGTEKGVDVMIATDLLYFAWSGFYDTAILVSGDADFAYAVQAVKNMGKHVEVAYFENGISRDLLEVADHRYLLDHNFFNSVWVIKQRPIRRKPPIGKPFQPRPRFKPNPNPNPNPNMNTNPNQGSNPNPNPNPNPNFNPNAGFNGDFQP